MSKKKFAIECTTYGLVTDHRRQKGWMTGETSCRWVLRKRPGESGPGCMSIVIFKTKEEAKEYINTEVKPKENKSYRIRKLPKDITNTMEW